MNEINSIDETIEENTKLKESIQKIKEEIKIKYELAIKQLHWGEAIGLQKAIDIIEKYKEIENGNIYR